MTTSLCVYLYGRRVGELRLDPNRRFEFQYDAGWVQSAGAVPLSISLPLQTDTYLDDKARPFFANLLPEADLRRAVARRLGISEQNDFALLEAIGGECAGAVTILSAGVAPTESGEYRSLSSDELDTLIENLPDRPLLAGEEGMRLSLAGAQNKLPVFFDGDHISLPLGAYASTHILKPGILHFEGTVANEAFCMQLAGRMALTVPPVLIYPKSKKALYLIERYDRETEASGKVLRIHQEDFCQALGVPPDTKYEKEGGPGLRGCFQLLRDVSVQPAADIKALLTWVVFNYLIGNADAHAKNIALLLPKSGPRLAPFYDLMCTAVYPNLTERMAMRIGSEDRPKWVIARQWETFAKDIHVNPKIVMETVLEMAGTIPEAANSLANEMTPSTITSKVVAVIKERAKNVVLAF